MMGCEEAIERECRPIYDGRSTGAGEYVQRRQTGPQYLGSTLLEVGDFTKFLLGGKLRDSVARKLQLPFNHKIQAA